MSKLRRLPAGTGYTVRNVIVADGGRGEIVKELRVLVDGHTFGTDPIPMDYR